MAGRKVDIREEYPPEYISLVTYMYERRQGDNEIIYALNSLYPNLRPLTVGILKKIMKETKGDTLKRLPMDSSMKTITIRFDSDIAEFLESLPYNPSEFVNAVMGMYLRDYKMKKAQREAEEENNNEVTRFG